MVSPASDIVTLLSTETALVAGTDLFVDNMPEEDPARGIPHRCVAVINSGGQSPNPLWDRDIVNLQILVRGPLNDPDNAYNLAYTVKDCLLGHNTVTINGSLYCSFIIEGDINNIGFDQGGRARFTMRFRVTRDNYIGSSRTDL